MKESFTIGGTVFVEIRTTYIKKSGSDFDEFSKKYYEDFDLSKDKNKRDFKTLLLILDLLKMDHGKRFRIHS
jgi:hypothetical protein